jgi:hypothetical protein
MPSQVCLPWVRCLIVRLDGVRPIPVTAARPGDELAALVEIDPGEGPADLLLEVCRGDEVRGRWSARVAGPARLAYRLRWQDRPAASARLAVRVWSGGVLLTSCGVLLLPGPADAQGRLPSRAAQAPVSDATRVAFQEHLRALLDEPPQTEKSDPRCAYPG